MLQMVKTFVTFFSKQQPAYVTNGKKNICDIFLNNSQHMSHVVKKKNMCDIFPNNSQHMSQMVKTIGDIFPNNSQHTPRSVYIF